MRAGSKCGLVMASVMAVNAWGQPATCGGQPPSYPRTNTWPPNAVITVYLDPESIPRESINPIKYGRSSWTDVGASGIHVSFVLDADRAQRNPPPPGTIGVVMQPLEGAGGDTFNIPGVERTRGSHIRINNKYA